MGILSPTPVDDTNQYTQLSGPSGPDVSLSYNNNGALTNWGNVVYSYDHLDRLVGVTSNGIELATYAYDALNRRISKKVSGVTTKYVYAGGNVLEEYQTSLLRSYV